MLCARAPCAPPTSPPFLCVYDVCGGPWCGSLHSIVSEKSQRRAVAVLPELPSARAQHSQMTNRSQLTQSSVRSSRASRSGAPSARSSRARSQRSRAVPVWRRAPIELGPREAYIAKARVGPRSRFGHVIQAATACWGVHVCLCLSVSVSASVCVCICVCCVCAAACGRVHM